MLKQLLSMVKSAGSEFRASPFWAWNAKMEPAELRRQIRIFHEMGLGGFFMHSRVGLNTPYLSEEWFKCISACADEAKKLKMQAWLYDEDRWPSGAAGGLVTKNPKYRISGLWCERATKAADLKTPAKDRLACFVAKFAKDGETIVSAKRVKALPAKAPVGSELMVFYVHTENPSSWFNDQTYLDTMNPEAVKKFLEVTHEAYLKHNGKDFGATIPGIFTDEPNYVNGCYGFLHAVPWTKALPKAFQKRFGYDVMDHLFELGYDIQGVEFSKARHDFYEIVTTLFVGSFGKLIGDWCGKHGLKYTGHVLCEDNMSSQRKCVSAAMRFYEYQQQPGIDLLCETWDPIDTAKQCSSVAHQLDKPTRLCECYGVTGWDFPFAGHKALGDWLAVLGINFRCPHLAWYSMAAEAKRDYPASISFQSSWYPYYSLVEDYFAHQAAALHLGEEIRDILVVHPIESAWGAKAQIPDAEKKAFDAPVIDLRNVLMASHLDFDYGDEDHLARFAKVTGKGTAAVLQVGVAKYRVVVLPKMLTIRGTTLKLLEDFVKAGGQVVYVEQIPGYLDAEKSAKPAKAFQAFAKATLETLPKLVAGRGRRVSITARGKGELPELFYMLKQGEDFETLFVANTSMKHEGNNPNECPRLAGRTAAYKQVAVTLKSGLDASAKVYELNQETGVWTKLDKSVKFSAGKFHITAGFAIFQSHLYVITKQTIPGALQETSEPKIIGVCELPHCCWEYSLDNPNAMVLDQAIYEVDGESDEQLHYILKIDDAVRVKMGHRPRGGQMVQPWVDAGRKPTKTVKLKLTYSFEVEALPAAESRLQLALERPDLYTITLNGKKVANKSKGYWVDPAIQTVPLKVADLKLGTNFMVLECDYHELLPGLEAMYLLGDFGVKGARTMTSLPEELDLGDWCSQGLPNYSGNVTYHVDFQLSKLKKGERVAVDFGKWAGALLGVRANGGELKLVGWAPYRVDITDQLKTGVNCLELVVLASRRNVFGPFYDYEQSPWWCGSEAFKHFQVCERHLVACGLLEPLTLLKMKGNS
ncbi:MAG: hypothetical protein IKO65_11850 [Victivallales bacterium]|nr:hypothetical protein [Victivallales bacterium]